MLVIREENRIRIFDDSKPFGIYPKPSEEINDDFSKEYFAFCENGYAILDKSKDFKI